MFDSESFDAGEIPVTSLLARIGVIVARLFVRQEEMARNHHRVFCFKERYIRFLC